MQEPTHLEVVAFLAPLGCPLAPVPQGMGLELALAEHAPSVLGLHYRFQVVLYASRQL